MRHILTLSVFLFTALFLQAQQDHPAGTNPVAAKGTVTGTITSAAAPVPSASVDLLKAKDSTRLRTALSDTAGHFSITELPAGDYLVRIEAVGYTIYYSKAFSLSGNYSVPDLQLTIAGQQLSGVVVTGHRPLIEQHLDKTVINVDASPSNTGLTTMDVLEKSPGISIDKDGNISLNGKPGPLVLVDGKPTYLGAGDLATLLTSLPSSQLDQIEIMSNPPAKYDAAGNAGVINIRTKKGRSKGLNGNVSLVGGFGIHGRSNDNFNLNYRTGKVNLFASYGYTYTDEKANFQLRRNILDPQSQSVLQIFDQTTVFNSITNNHTFKVGLDADISKRTTLGFSVSGLISPSRDRNGDTTAIFNAHHGLDSITVANSEVRKQFNNIGTNVNLRHVFDTSGTELNVDLDYLHYHSGNDQLFNNYFFDARFDPTDPASSLLGHLPENINIYSAKVDYTQTLPGHTRLDLGAKSSYVRSDNNAQYFDGITKDAPVDDLLTNHFLYKENINAGYINLNTTFSPRWTAQAGLRVENTHAEGDQHVNSQSFRRNYTQLFPTAYLEYTLNDNNKFGLDYGRRIQRPDYEDMNPFYYFLDKYTYAVGNPGLQPQLSNTIELKHIFRDFLTSTISYSKTDNIIASIVRQEDSSKIDFETSGNIASAVNYSVSVSFNQAVTHWWKINVFAQEYYNHLHGALPGGEIDEKKFTFSTNISNQFDIRSGWGLELSGLYSGSSLSGTFIRGHRVSLNFGASKQILNSKGTLRLSIRDFANTLDYHSVIRYQNNDQIADYKPDSRVVNLSFTYRFSKGKAGKQREHTGASEEEQSRLKTN